MDWISDGIARIRNAIANRQVRVIVRGTKIFLQILEIMKQEGFIKGYAMQENAELKQACVVNLLYRDTKSVIRGLKRISKPSLHKYIKSSEIAVYLKRFSVPIISTSVGMLSGKHAFSRKLGGELICEVM